MGSTNHTVVALVGGLAVVDEQTMALAHAADAVLVAGLQFLSALVPGDHDLGVVNSDLAFKCGSLVFSCGLVADVLQDGHRLEEERGLLQQHCDLRDHLDRALVLGLVQVLLCSSAYRVPLQQPGPPAAG